MRAKDLHLAAKVFENQRTVIITGAIDRNDVSYFVNIDLPDSGLWTIIKAETNLTGSTWDRWVMFLGEGTQIPSQEKDRLLFARNFNKAKYFAAHNAIVFCDGEVRNGEPVLKYFNIELVAGNNSYKLAHGSRSGSGVGTGSKDNKSAKNVLKDSLKNAKPTTTLDIPTQIISDDYPGKHHISLKKV